MEVTPDVSKSSEGILAADNSSSDSRKPESGQLQLNGSENVANSADGGAEDMMDMESMQSEDTSGTVKEGKKRAAMDDPLEAGDFEDEFSSNSHNGVPGVNGMAKAKPAAKKPKLEESRNIREPACWRCREAGIPCIGSSTRSSCNACFHHHWKCATNPPTVRGKKPKNNTISANALKHLLFHPVGSKNTRSKGMVGKSNTISDSISTRQTLTETPPPDSASTSTPATFRETASAPAPTTKEKEKAKAPSLAHLSRPSTSTPSDLPVLMLAPPSVYIPPLKLGPPAPLPASILTESSMSASASASSSRHNRNPTRPQERGAPRSRRKVPVPPTFSDPVGDKTSGDKILGWPGQTKTRANPGRSARPVRREFDLDTDEEEEEQEGERPTLSAADKGKQKAHEPGDISELSSPPSSTGSTPDPSTSLLPTAALEPRSLPTSSTLPTVVTTLNALTNSFKAMQTDLGEVKDTTATLSGSKSSLDWGIALDKLDRQEKLISQQGKVVEAQGKMINAMVRKLKEFMGEKFVFDFDMDEVYGGGGGVMTCNAKSNGTTTTPGSGSVVANDGASRIGGNGTSQSFDMALRPVVTDMSINSGSSTWGPVDTSANKGLVYTPVRPIPVRKASSGSTPTPHTPTTTVLSTHTHDLPPPRAISFMRPQQKAATTSNDSRNQASTSKPAAAGEASVASSSSSTQSSNASEERPSLASAHWFRTRADGDSDEEKDELLDESPMQPNLRQRAWVKTQMMALR
ncbi:hypothetical protein L218DRAFT_967171 [Marasmius fiardii PR-910]|nr:hypothetical protein L218DRAFT_967171 [Marasmius fiardii PR-910]